MNVDYVNLSEYNVKFKQLISGPAPVGRILNYIILTGKKVLKHKKGYRNLNLKDGIASAWCSEFMVGLGLVTYNEVDGENVYDLNLTDDGNKLYNIICNYKGAFNESSDPKECRIELIKYSKKAYDIFFNIFKKSPVCINLCRYLENNGNNIMPKQNFYDNYFKCFKSYYEEKDTQPIQRNAGFNRVPSLLQLCSFFGCLTEDKLNYIFNYDILKKYEEERNFITLDDEKVNNLNDEDKKHELIVTDLVGKYGVDGNVVREVLTRNSSVQQIFRNNLIVKYGCECAICKKSIESVLIASHIVPSSESDVHEKADCENGLLLCALHDKLFDRYLISFDFVTGKLLYSSILESHLEDYQLSKDFTLDEKYLTDKRKDYLMKHNMVYYERNK